MTGTAQAEPGPDPLLKVVLRAPRITRWRAAQIGGTQLRELRQQRGLTQKALAARAGISNASISRLEGRPATTCLEGTTARLATALGAGPADLRPGQAHAQAAMTAMVTAVLSAALASARVNATVTTTQAGPQIELPITPANITALINALAQALDIAAQTGP